MTAYRLQPRTGSTRILLASLLLFVVGGIARGEGTSRPDILVITVDTLRADRLSGYGYGRDTSPNLDGLFEGSVVFTDARTVEPLTSPALCSMITATVPHVHGSTRNRLSMRPGLDSLPKRLELHGYTTAAVLGNWTLRDKNSGLGEHFDSFDVVLTRRRWLGLLYGEATGEDLNEHLLDWLRDEGRPDEESPLFLWIHYTEPHAPYRFWKDYADQIGLESRKNVPAADRYDTEVAFVDAVIGELLRSLDREDHLRDTIVVFASDHGESLGEHDYWGHGRHLYEPGLRIPLSFSWPGRIAPGTVDAPALITDIAPTLLGLLDIEEPEIFDGYDWSGVLLHGAAVPGGRVTFYQAHKGAVVSAQKDELARRAGLLEVAVIDDGVKEILRVGKGRVRRFDLGDDPAEERDLTEKGEAASERLRRWLERVQEGLDTFEDMPVEELDEESIERLRALGYVE
jgi:arylsulfatase A-like enzyme